MSARIDLLTRREALVRVSALLGGAALVGQSALLAGCATTGSSGRRSSVPELFTASDVALLDEVADTILPDTSTPGAKAAGVGPFMALMVADVYDAREQRVFIDGLAKLERASTALNGVPFLQASAAQRVALLETLDREQLEHMRGLPETELPHYFRMIKELALLGYFTSEIGYTRAMRYTEVPGRFEPCVTLAPGDTSWAPHA
jgi:glucoside 3-dehydrogenase (cytochrome c) hitch-hiker subunit